MGSFENGEQKKLSFGFSIADEKIKLIDILTENDDFLIASPLCGSLQDSFSDSTREDAGFRISGFGNSSELEIFQQRDRNRSPSDLVKLQRPSCHRKSLAWDSAFFNSPGVLDPDELSCINKGFKTVEAHSQDVRKRRSKSASRPNGDGVCADWFEIEPSIYKPKSTKMFGVANKCPESGPKQEHLQNVLAVKKFDRAFRTEVKSNQTCTGKSISKMESTARRRQGTISSPKPPKALLGRNISTKSKYSRDFSGKSNVNSCTKTSSASKIWRRAERNKSISPSTGRWSSESQSSSVDKNKKGSHGSKIDLDIKKKIGGPFVRNDENEASHLQCPFNTPKQYSGICSVGSLSAKNFRPSGLRPPSPLIGFFDENTSPRYHDITRNRKLPQKVLSEAGSSCLNTQFAYSNSTLSPDSSITSRYASARKKLKSPCSEVTKNIKRPKTDHSLVSELVKPTKKATDQENRTKINLSCSDVDQLGNLSRYFTAIDLNREKLTQLRKRAPLADKTASCNSGATFEISIS